MRTLKQYIREFKLFAKALSGRKSETENLSSPQKNTPDASEDLLNQQINSLQHKWAPKSDTSMVPPRAMNQSLVNTTAQLKSQQKEIEFYKSENETLRDRQLLMEDQQKKQKQLLETRVKSLLFCYKQRYGDELKKYRSAIKKFDEMLKQEKSDNVRLRREGERRIDQMQLLKLEYDELVTQSEEISKHNTELENTNKALLAQKNTWNSKVVSIDAIKTARDQLVKHERALKKQLKVEQQLRAEIAQLNSQIDQLKRDSVEEFVKKLKYLGMVGVCYQPGGGHLTITADHLISFVKNPGAFSVTHSDVSEDTYRAWLTHIETPCCTAILPDGSICGEPVDRCGDPIRFTRGVSDRCEKHQRKALPMKPSSDSTNMAS